MLQIAIADDEKKPRRALRDILEPWLELQAVPCQLWEYESGEKPVSYTHLDVYKRQEEDCSF